MSSPLLLMRPRHQLLTTLRCTRTARARLNCSNYKGRQAPFSSQARKAYTRNEPKVLWATTLLCLTFIAWHFKPMLPTTGPSMLPTILVNDGVVWSPWHRRGRGIAVGDLVAARSPYEPGAAIVKRVLGMPGDVVCVLGRPDHDDDDDNKDADAAMAGETFEKELQVVGGEARYIVVPQGHCWVEGDNLPWSVDSRHYGPIPLGLIVGKVVAIRGPTFWSWRWIGNDKLVDV